MASEPFKILIVDDSATARKIVAGLCRKIGLEQIVEAESAEEGMVQLLVEGDFDLILCDLNMPGTNGLQFLMNLKNNVLTRTIPFVFLTSESEARLISAARANGADAYLVKPIHYDAFKDEIERFWRQSTPDLKAA